jgi:hypothetical protein
MIGQAGVEQAYNKLLMGADGDRFVVVNSVGREIREVREQPTAKASACGDIDADVQRAIEEGFTASGFNGAAVVLDPGWRSASDSRAGCLRSQRLRGRRRSRHVGVAQHRRFEAAAESCGPGSALRAPPSRWQ